MKMDGMKMDGDWRGCQSLTKRIRYPF